MSLALRATSPMALVVGLLSGEETADTPPDWGRGHNGDHEPPSNRGNRD